MSFSGNIIAYVNVTGTNTTIVILTKYNAVSLKSILHPSNYRFEEKTTIPMDIAKSVISKRRFPQLFFE